MCFLSLRAIRLLTLAILIGASPIAAAEEATPDVVAALGGQSRAPVESAQKPKGVSAAELQALLASPEVRGFRGLSENAWDFNDPTTIPGFGAMPLTVDSSGGAR